MPSIEKFIRRVSQAENSQNKDIRLSIQEARQLMQDLALLTGNLGKTVGDIYLALEEIKKTSTEVDVKFDGGGF